MASEMPTGASLALSRVTKRFGGETAVDGISLHVDPGEFLTLLGPSGSGKTTTLNMIAGFTEPTDGEISMDGAAITRVPAHRRNIGMVFQHYALFPHMTAMDNIAFPLKQRMISRDETRARLKAVLELVDLAHLAERYPRELSGGQQQRVALARAIVFRPRVLLMDEPLGALDRKLRETLQLEIKRIHQRLGITFVYVTHDQEEALALSTRIAVYREGRIEQVGDPTELYERPSTLFVAEFVGESNVFRGRLAANDGRAVVDTDNYRITVPASEDVEPGARAAVVVRPERLRVDPTGASRAVGENRANGVVDQVVYLGSTRRLIVRLDGSELITAREASTAASGIEEGDRVTVSWSRDDSILLYGDAVGPTLDRGAGEPGTVGSAALNRNDVRHS